MLENNLENSRHLLPYFILLLALFLFRVTSQLLQYYFDLPFLPSFESWDSGTLPYKILLCLQLIIIIVLSKTVYKIALGKISPNIKTGYILITLGTLYFSIMFFRLVAGLTIIDHIQWFSYPIPSFFHIVLASFVILFGYFHLSNNGGELIHA